jgi:hypothetical protein
MAYRRQMFAPRGLVCCGFEYGRRNRRWRRGGAEDPTATFSATLFGAFQKELLGDVA